MSLSRLNIFSVKSQVRPRLSSEDFVISKQQYYSMNTTRIHTRLRLERVGLCSGSSEDLLLCLYTRHIDVVMFNRIARWKKQDNTR